MVTTFPRLRFIIVCGISLSKWITVKCKPKLESAGNSLAATDD